MIYTKPDYYDEFVCIADKCPDTCCAGWQIVIDEDSLERYGQEQGAYQKVLHHSIDWEAGVFLQGREKRCAFLNSRNLCEMYLKLGANSLCHTCTQYPRHLEEFENVREYTLSVSCPEAARILLNKREPVTFTYWEDEKEEEFEEYNPFLFSVLEDGREVIRGILQNRSLSLSHRIALVWKLADKLQEYLDADEIFSCQELFLQYEEGLIDVAEVKEDYAFAYKSFRNLYQLEQLSDDWEGYLIETENMLYQPGEEHYLRLKQEFADWWAHKKQDGNSQNSVDCLDWSRMAEQLLVYFIYTYFCGAVYDYAPAAKVRMAILSVHYIYEMLLVKWLKNKKTLDMEDVIFFVYRYSRELEHSDENLDLMEELVI